MRIAISGTSNTGKTTLIKSFLEKWSTYETPKKTYRDIIVKEKLEHSSKSSTKTQDKIIEFMLDQVKDKTKTVDDNIIYDRCPLDALAYSMWCNSKGYDGFDNDYIQNQINEVKESMRFLDIIFLCRFDENIPVVDDGTRDTDIDHIKEVDNIFEALYQQYYTNVHADVFFPKDDSPAIIKLPSNHQSRTSIISEYVTDDGGMYGDEHSILHPDNINELETLVEAQKVALDQEQSLEDALKKDFDIGDLRM
tara:strand:- start:11246 stop:11998 length:753 start_codon:yes stop_codon:yes gene_type:complete